MKAFGIATLSVYKGSCHYGQSRDAAACTLLIPAAYKQKPDIEQTLALSPDNTLSRPHVGDAFAHKATSQSMCFMSCLTDVYVPTV